MKKILILLLTVLVVSCIRELQPPHVEILAPSDGTEFTIGETVDVRIDASDDDGSIEELRIYVDDIGTTSIGGFPYTTSFPTADLEAGAI